MGAPELSSVSVLPSPSSPPSDLRPALVYRPKFGYGSHGPSLGSHGPKLGNAFRRPDIKNIRPKFAYKRPSIGFRGGNASIRRPGLGYHAPRVQQIYKQPTPQLWAPQY